MLTFLKGNALLNFGSTVNSFYCCLVFGIYFYELLCGTVVHNQSANLKGFRYDIQIFFLRLKKGKIKDFTLKPNNVNATTQSMSI